MAMKLRSKHFKKVETDKAKIMMALTYLNRYYDIKYGDMSIKTS